MVALVLGLRRVVRRVLDLMLRGEGVVVVVVALRRRGRLL